MRGKSQSRPVGATTPREAELGRRWGTDWQEYLDRKVLLERARSAQVTALKELYDRYHLRLLLVEKRLPDAKRRALMVHIVGDCWNR